jgi:hypothetical protein
MQQSNRTVGDFSQNGSTQRAGTQNRLNLTSDQNYFYMLVAYLAHRYPTGLTSVSELELRNLCQEIAFVSSIAAEEWQSFSETWSGVGIQHQNLRQQGRAA